MFLNLSLIGGWEAIFAILLFGALLSIYAWRKQEKDAMTPVHRNHCRCYSQFYSIPKRFARTLPVNDVIPTTVLFSYGISKIRTLGGSGLNFCNTYIRSG
jgi:hypothetical protein